MFSQIRIQLFLRLTFSHSLFILCILLSTLSSNASNDNLNSPQTLAAQSLNQSIQTYIARTNYFKWGQTVYEGPLLDKIYLQRQYQSIWLTSDYNWTSLAAEAIQLLKNAHVDGLNPNFYWTKDLESAYQKVFAEKDMSYAILFELGLTDSLYRYAKDSSVGRLNPKLVDGDEAYPSRQWSQSDWNTFFSAINLGTTPAASVTSSTMVGSPMEDSSTSDLGKILSTLEPTQFKYVQLKSTLGKILNAADGAQTVTLLDSMGIPASAKVLKSELIEKISANMERLRWLPAQLGTRFGFVNLALQELNIFENDQSVLAMKTVNGKSFRRTVSMITNLTDVKLNPHWTAAYTPLQEDELPSIRNDINFLANGRFFVTVKSSYDLTPPLMGDNGQPHQYYENRRVLTQMEITALPWQTMTAKEFESRGLLLVQDSGPKNALGTIKFELDDPFTIYMHDTNRRDLFSKAIRLESSGCMRLENPSELAYYLLKNRTDYSTSDTIENQLMNGDPIHDASLQKDFFIHLTPEERLTVYTAYLTTEATEDGKLRIAKDWYGIDARIKELNTVKPIENQTNMTKTTTELNSVLPSDATGTLVVNGEAGPGQLFRKVLAVHCTPEKKYSCEKNIIQGNLNEPIALPAGDYLVGFENSIYPGWVTIESGSVNTLTLEKIKIPTSLIQEQSVSIAKDYSKDIERLKLGSQLFYLGKYLFGSGSYSSFDDFYLVNSSQSDYLSRIDYGACVEKGSVAILAKDVQTKGMKLTALCSDWLSANSVQEIQTTSSLVDQSIKGGTLGMRYVHKGSFNSPFYIPFANKPHLVSTPIKGDQFVSVFPGSYLIYKTGKSASGKSVNTDHISTGSFKPSELIIPDKIPLNQNDTAPTNDTGV